MVTKSIIEITIIACVIVICLLFLTVDYKGRKKWKLILEHMDEIQYKDFNFNYNFVLIKNGIHLLSIRLYGDKKEYFYAVDEISNKIITPSIDEFIFMKHKMLKKLISLIPDEDKEPQKKTFEDYL